MSEGRGKPSSGHAGRWGRRGLAVVFSLALAGAALAAHDGPPQTLGEAPRVQALLDQAWAAESGRGIDRSPALAARLYQEAGQLGSSEGYYRAARIYWHNPASPPPAATLCRLSIASQLGHAEAIKALERAHARGDLPAVNCSDRLDTVADIVRFDLEGYLEGLPSSKQHIAGLIRRLAPRYGVDTHLALAVAAVESNFDHRALSPKNAMGVMQLIPATAERFAVRDPYDPEQNIRGGLAYLRWLHGYFRGDAVSTIAAYNAGEKAVDRYGGIPPYPETMIYVSRVLNFAGKEAADRAKRSLAEGNRR